MGLKQLLLRSLPASFKNHLRRLKSKNSLGSVKKRVCDTKNLCSKDDISLPDILNSQEIDAFWKISSKEINHFYIPDGSGGVNPGDRRALYYLICALRPKSILEIGTHIGASTLYIASALGNSQSEIDKKFTTLDIRDVNSQTNKPWLQFGTKFSPIEMVSKFGYNSFVKFITGKSLEFLDNTDQRFDFIFLDGDHAAKTVYQEIPAALKRLKPNGVILLHDYFPNSEPLWSKGRILYGPFMGTQRLIDEGADLKVLPLGSLPWPTKRGSNVTSLALLTRK